MGELGPQPNDRDEDKHEALDEDHGECLAVGERAGAIKADYSVCEVGVGAHAEGERDGEVGEGTHDEGADDGRGGGGDDVGNMP